MYFFGDDDVEEGCVFVWSARKRVMVCVENFEIKTKKKKKRRTGKGEALKQPTKYIRVITISLPLSVSPFLYSSMRRSLSSLSLFPFARGKACASVKR